MTRIFSRSASRYLAVLATLAAAVMLLGMPATAWAQVCQDCEPGGGGGGGGGGGVPSVTVTGRFTYKDMTRFGDTTSDLVPIASAKVEIWRFKPRDPFGFWLWGKDAEATTDADGRISLRMPFERTGIRYAARVFATNDAVKVWPEQPVHTAPFYREPGEDNGSPIQPSPSSASQGVDFTFDFTSRWTAQHFNVAETLRVGREYMDGRRTDTDPLGQVNVTISAASPFDSSYYNYLADEIVIGIGGNAFQAFDDEVLLHEYAHHVLDQISTVRLAPATHTGCDADADAQFAWSEGAATYLAWAVKRVNSANTLRVFPVEATSTCTVTPGNEVEERVSGALWDLADPVGALPFGESFDQVDAMDTEVLQVIDHFLDRRRGSPEGTIGMFRSAWATHGLDLLKLDQILIGNGIPTT